MKKRKEAVTGELEYPESRMDVDEVLKKFSTNLEGLSTEEVQKRQQIYGKNAVEKKKPVTLLKIIFSQFQNKVLWILLGAALLSYLIGNHKDAVGISIAIVLSISFGTIMEYKSEKALLSLKKMSSLRARVKRNSVEAIIDSEELVPGDIVILEEGVTVPADIRLLMCNNIMVNEAILTGESLPVDKSCKKNENNILYSGTVIVRGNGKGVVIATGKKTAFGKIAELIQKEENEPTPLQKNMEELSEKLSLYVIIICGLFFFLGFIFLKKEFFEILTTSVILAVAGVPEGLPTTMAIALALGMHAMSKKNALVKKMHVIEDLGLITAVCTDKTGTLTTNKMQPKNLYIYDKVFEIDTHRKQVDKGAYSSEYQYQVELLLKTGILANNSTLAEEGIGDQTEVAILETGRIYGLEIEKIRNAYKRLHENIFDSDRKLMSVVAKDVEEKLFVKGALEQILDRSEKILISNEVRELTNEIRERVLKAGKTFGKKGMRIIAFAYRSVQKKQDYSEEKHLVFLGFISIYDPPRAEIKETLELCRTAGIKVYMITGDAKETAINIANETGFESTNAMSGEELVSLNKNERMKVLDRFFIFYRVSPIQKYEIVSALKEKGEIIAVTGDGVNDAPAIKKADIGIVMGKTGADITKDLGGMVLLDDNFKTLVEAIKHGRKIYENILNFIRFQLTTTTSLISLMFFSALLGFGEPLKAIHMLFINLIMDGPPAIALGLEPPDNSIMRKRPRDPKRPYIELPFIATIAFGATFMVIATLLLIWQLKSYNVPEAKATTMIFFTMVMFQLLNALNCRSNDQHFFLNLSNNKLLIGSISASFIILLASLYVEELSAFMYTTQLTYQEMFFCIIYAMSIIVAEEVRKFSIRKLSKKNTTLLS